MKKLLIGIAVVLAVIAAAPAHAAPIAINDMVIVDYWSGADRYSNGGVFGVWAATLSGGKGAFLFPTFCVETTEYFGPGDPYKVQRLSADIVKGGKTTSRPLPGQVAWLYTQYLKLPVDQQKLLGDDYQAAVWYFVTDHNGLYNELAKSAESHSGSIGDVRVLGLDTNGGVQDFLVLTVPETTNPVPEPGSMLLLGTGLFGLAGAVRRRIKK